MKFVTKVQAFKKGVVRKSDPLEERSTSLMECTLVIFGDLITLSSSNIFIKISLNYI